jgi:hypothetical protein
MLTVRHLAMSTSLKVAVIGSALVAALGAGTWSAQPAQASLSGGDWVLQTLPPGFVIGDNAPSFAPVSCVPGTKFCVVIAGDTALVNPTTFNIEQADLVTTNGGQTWTPFTGLPLSSTSLTYFNAISCPTTSVCWITGTGNMAGSGGSAPLVAESTDSGQTWTVRSPASWLIGNSVYWANAIDCVSATVCWIAGTGPSSLSTPFVAATTDGGASWTTFQNLPSFTPYDPNGTYSLNSIWCASALSCVAAGGLNEGDGQAQVVSTSDGGATWSLSPDPTLHSLQQLFSLSCRSVPGALPTCHAAASANSAAGPVVVTSTDGGTTWSGRETVDKTGWMSAISCADAQHCWAAGAGTKLGLLGTNDGGSAWSTVMSDTSNEYGQLACPTSSFCVATTDSALWVTTDGGGLQAPARAAGSAATKNVTIPLPRSTASVAYARTGSNVTISNKYRGTSSPKTVTAVVINASGKRTTTSVPIGLNGFYSLKLQSIPGGTTSIAFTANGAAKVALRLVGHPGPAPKVSTLSSQAGPAAGGAKLTITGANLTGVRAVYVGGKKATNIRVISSTKLAVTAPAGSRAQYVRVLTAKGGLSPLTGRAIYNYLAAPELTGVTPSAGPPAGGTTVTITGTGLAYVKTVSFGANQATNLRLISPQKIKVTAPAGSGTVNIRVRTAGGTTPIVPADQYTY